QKPRAAKRLYFDVIPRTVDEYLDLVQRFANEPPEKQIENPVWHIHDGRPPPPEARFSYAILLNLAAVVNAEEPSVLWGYITRYAPDATPASQPMLDRLVRHAIAYYRDFVKPAKQYRAPNAIEREALADLAEALEAAAAGADA